MKENNIIEQFDDLFREQLGNANAPVPPGVWESVASSIGTGAAAATTTVVAVKTALWVKVAIVASVIGAGTFITYKALENNDPANPNTPNVIENNAKPQGDITEDKLAGTNGSNGMDHEGTLVQPLAPGKDKPTVPYYNPGNSRPLGSDYNIPEQARETGPVNFKMDEELLKQRNEPERNNPQAMNPAKGDSIKASKAEQAPVKPKKVDTTVASAQGYEKPYKFFPGSFSPGNNGYNDSFKIIITGEEYVQVIIYNLKYEKIFETRNKYEGWSGRLPNGEMAPEGDYILMVIYKFKNADQASDKQMIKLIKDR